MDFAALASEFKRRHVAIGVFLFLMVNAFAVAASAGPFSQDGEETPMWETVLGTWVPGRAPTPAPPIWVGSPVAGTWGNSGRPGSTPAGGHHLLGKASPSNHWAVDLPVGGGAQVLLYVAAADAANDAGITTAITQIVDDHACIGNGGGDFVTVGVYFEASLVGHVTYAHLDRDPSLQVGAPIGRWGTSLGKVANLSGRATGGSRCWTGPHVHLEMRAQNQRACWTKSASVGRRVNRTDPIGFVSGNLAPSSAPCP